MSQNPFFPSRPNSAPVYGHVGRSPLFQAYLDAQPPSRRAALLAAEAQYLQERTPASTDDQKSSTRAALFRSFEESLQGFEDRAPGGVDTTFRA